jgi:hypothetical protein
MSFATLFPCGRVVWLRTGDNDMATPERKPDYPGSVWVDPDQCDHPHDAVRNPAMSFVSADVAVMEAHCLKCGGHWTNPHDMPWRIFAVTMRKIAEGTWTAISADDPEIDAVAKFRLAQRRSEILDLLGDEGR